MKYFYSHQVMMLAKTELEVRIVGRDDDGDIRLVLKAWAPDYSNTETSVWVTLDQLRQIHEAIAQHLASETPSE